MRDLVSLRVSELSVLALIITALVTIAIPSYKQFTLKKKIARAHVVLLDLKEKVVKEYQNAPHDLAYGITFRNTYIPKDMWTDIKLSSVLSVRYKFSSDQSILLSAKIGDSDNLPLRHKDLRPAKNPDSPYAIHNLVVILASNNIYCGTWDDLSQNHIPMSLLSADCSCQNLKKVALELNFNSCMLN